MLLLAEKLVLLSLNQEKGKIDSSNANILRFGIPGALLMDLKLQNRVQITKNSVRVANDAFVNDDLLDYILKLIIESEQTHSLAFWIKRINADFPNLTDRILTRLVNQNILELQIKKIFWIIPMKYYTLTNDDYRKSIIDDINNTLTSNKEPNEEILVILGILTSCRRLDLCFTETDEAGVRKRIEILLRKEKIGVTIKSLIEEQQELLNSIYAMSSLLSYY